MEDYRKDYPVSVLCETLGVSLSGYSAWKKRPMSNHQREDKQLAEHIQEVYHSCRQVYGSPRIHAELRDQGITSSRKRVARLMREQGRLSRAVGSIGRPRRKVSQEHAWLLTCWIRILQRRVPMRSGPAILPRYGPMKAGSRLSVVLDLFSRRVIGWAMAAIQDETLIETALRMALLGRQPAARLLFPSDRGSQYTSDAYRATLAEVGIMVSMSRTGNCYDNAVTESFFGTLKGECVERACFQTRREARQTIFDYVECFYNRVRRHSSLGYVSPVAYEQVMC